MRLLTNNQSVRILKTFSIFVYTFATEAPFTLFALIISVAAYYILRYKIIKKFRLKLTSFPSIIVGIFYIVEFIVMFFGFVYLLGLIGFKIPENTF